jgi:hypothetical protein
VSAPSSCGTDGKCNGAGNCSRYPAGTTCGPATCMVSVLTPSVCDGSGTCGPGTPTDCTPYRCSTGQSGPCPTTCTSNGDCAAGYRCANRTCTK